MFSLGCDELSLFYQQVDLGDGFVALLSTDGTMLARGPLVPGLIGAASISTRYSASVLSRNEWRQSAITSSHFNVREIASFRRLQDYPLIVMVGIDTDTVFQQFRAAARANDRRAASLPRWQSA